MSSSSSEYNVSMKRFKWHGIPVNLPDSRAEWLAVGVLLFVEAIVIVVLAIAYISK